MTTPFGAVSAWRQLTDLIARRHVTVSGAAYDRLRAIRARVPAAIRRASARGVAQAVPPAELVRLFAEDLPTIAAPVLATARLEPHEWLALLPDLPLASRALLRHRRDLSAEVARALDAFGPADFALPMPHPVLSSEVPDNERASLFPSPPVREPAHPAIGEAATDGAATGPFPIADLVARIDAYRRDHGEIAPSVARHAGQPIDDFRFETDEAATIRWVDGAPREPLVGLALALATSRVDGVIGGAFRHRASFDNARLVIAGDSAVAGAWRVSAVAAFDPATGRFTGYRGTARRPRADERAERGGEAAIRPDSLRQLVHELRTPTAAISGFAEMIEQQVLGPAPDVYRDRAGTIRSNVRDLLNAIEDVDTAARIDQKALALRPARMEVEALLARVVSDMEPLMRLRESVIGVVLDTPGLAIAGDAVAVERVVARLVSTSVAATAPGERIAIHGRGGGSQVILEIDRPHALAALPESELFSLEQGGMEEGGASLLGTGFALRLARNLAAELGGGLTIEEDRLTLRLPAALGQGVEQQSSH